MATWIQDKTFYYILQDTLLSTGIIKKFMIDKIFCVNPLTTVCTILGTKFNSIL